jgi:hypothetical protein
MDIVKLEDYSAFPWPERLWFVVVFLAVAVLVARYRPGWLRALWLDAWLLAVAGTLLAGGPGWPDPLLVVEIVLLSGIPTGLTALWLAHTRGHLRLGMAAVQGVNAPIVYWCGIVVGMVILEGIWAVTGPRRHRSTILASGDRPRVWSVHTRP